MRRFSKEITTTAGIMNAKTRKLPVIKDTKHYEQRARTNDENGQ